MPKTLLTSFFVLGIMLWLFIAMCMYPDNMLAACLVFNAMTVLKFGTSINWPYFGQWAHPSYRDTLACVRYFYSVNFYFIIKIYDFLGELMDTSGSSALIECYSLVAHPLTDCRPPVLFQPIYTPDRTHRKLLISTVKKNVYSIKVFQKTSLHNINKYSKNILICF